MNVLAEVLRGAAIAIPGVFLIQTILFVFVLILGSKRLARRPAKKPPEDSE